MHGYIALTLMARTREDVAISIQMENDLDSLVLFEGTGYRADVMRTDEGQLTIYRDVRLSDEEVGNSLENMMAAIEAGVI